MKIAQISPLYESVPPKQYGGTERVVSFLTESLVRRGHDVTLFASGDSTTTAALVSMTDHALRGNGCRDPIAPHLQMAEVVLRRSGDFDLLHFHVDYLHFPSSARSAARRVTTMHGRLDLPELAPLLALFRHEPLVAISENQRHPVPFANWVGTIHHGLPLDLHAFRPERGSYLAFLGRFSRDKGPDRAIEISRRAGMPIKLAAKVDPADRDYFEEEIAPKLADPLVEYVGEIGEAEKSAFLGGAAALVFAIDWPEPFGLVMIEALACGTPVIAFRDGSVPEVIEDGVTGFVVDDVAGAVEAIRRLGEIDRRTCRQRFEDRFDAERMVDEYLDVYARIAG